MPVSLPLDRILYVVALAGLLVVTHLGVQQQRGFEEGCVGTSFQALTEDSAPDPGGDTGSSAGASSASGCGSVVQSEAGTFMGLSNVGWGFLFYGLVALLSALRGGAGWRPELLGRIREVVVTAGMGYTGFLVYVQYAVLETFCPLCMISAGLVSGLFLVTAVDVWGETDEDRAASGDRSAERIGWYGWGLGATVLLAIADVLLLGRGLAAGF